MGVNEALHCWSVMKISHSLPEKGGVLDQDKRLMDMILIIEAEFQKDLTEKIKTKDK